MSKHSVNSLKDVTLLLAGHGSSKPGDGNPVHALTVALKATGLFAAVYEGYLKQAPFLCDVLDHIATDELFVVPMLTGHGYITDELIPESLSKIAPATTIHIGEPIGCHPSIPDLLAGLIRSVIDDNRLERESVAALLAAHGNRNNPQNANQVKALAAAITNKSNGVIVTAAFIEESPLISDWRTEIKTKNLIVLPFLIGGGLHGAEDVPVMIGLDPQRPDIETLGASELVAGPFKEQGQSIWYCRALGYEPALTQMVIDLVEKTL